MSSPIRSKYGRLQVREEARERRRRAEIGSQEGTIEIIPYFDPETRLTLMHWRFTPVNGPYSEITEITTPIIPTPPPFEVEK
ncbi:MAG: hypothetical protein JXA94_05145 [Parachlamydiales bacterium]|nr:hypothetical protein [Parachlamydiales bacterium]